MGDEKPESLGGLDALANLAKHFIIRDVIYAIGGGVLILSVSYASGTQPAELVEQSPTIVSLLLVGVAWAVGYAVADGLGGIVPALLNGSLRSGAKPCEIHSPRLWPFVRTDYFRKPQKMPRILFESFAQEKWETPTEEEVSVDNAREMAAALIDREFGSYHRTVLLRHLGSAIGGCGFLAGIIAFIGTAFRPNTLGWALSVGGIIVSALLLAIGWVKALQQAHDINKAVMKSKHASQKLVS